MTRSLRRVPTLVVVLALPLLLAGCGKPKAADQAADGPPGGRQGPFGRQGREDSKVRQVMNRIGRGSQSLNSQLQREVKETSLNWDKIQPQAAELVHLATDLLGTEPQRGSKESWTKQTTSFVDRAKALDKAAQAKDVKGVQTAHAEIAQSCTECHRVHRGRGRGGFGFGGPMGFRGPMAQPGKIVPPFLEERLHLSADQKKQVDDLQKEVDKKLDTILTPEQKRTFHETRPGFGRGGFGRGGRGPGGPGGEGRPPRRDDGTPD